MILVAAGCGSSMATTKPSSPPAASTASEVSSLLAGIPQHGSTLGDPKAPLTVEYFGDLECPFCREFTLGTLRVLIDSYVRSGKLKIKYRSLETATHEPELFKTQQVAALAAGEQDKMWNFIELFYHEQHHEDSGYVTESYLQGLAQQVPGLNLIEWTAARNDVRLVNTLVADARTARIAGLDQTPSFLIAGSPNAPYYTAISKLLRD